MAQEPQYNRHQKIIQDKSSEIQHLLLRSDKINGNNSNGQNLNNKNIINIVNESEEQSEKGLHQVQSIEEKPSIGISASGAHFVSSNSSQVKMNEGNYQVDKTIKKERSGGMKGPASTYSQNTTQPSRQKIQTPQQGNFSSTPQVIASPVPQSVIDSCIFCQKFSAFHSFGPLLNKALYSKYSSSQNYFYSKDINDILGSTSLSSVINFRDLECLDEEEEFLKRIYLRDQLPKKMVDLTEYYKYHKDIPRLFMLNIGNTMNRYHDKRRRIEYQRIKQQLNFDTSNNENSEDSQFVSEEEEDSQGKKSPKNKQIPKECDNMLENLDVSLSFHKRMEQKQKHLLDNPTRTLTHNKSVSPYSNMNPFYMNSQPNKVYSMHQQNQQQNVFDMSSLLKKPSNKNFFPKQSTVRETLTRKLPNNFNYNYSKKNNKRDTGENEGSYQLSNILQSFQQSETDKFFYSTELSNTNLDSILYEKTNQDVSTVSQGKTVNPLLSNRDVSKNSFINTKGEVLKFLKNRNEFDLNVPGLQKQIIVREEKNTHQQSPLVNMNDPEYQQRIKNQHVPSTNPLGSNLSGLLIQQNSNGLSASLSSSTNKLSLNFTKPSVGQVVLANQQSQPVTSKKYTKLFSQNPLDSNNPQQKSQGEDANKVGKFANQQMNILEHLKVSPSLQAIVGNASSSTRQNSSLSTNQKILQKRGSDNFQAINSINQIDYQSSRQPSSYKNSQTSVTTYPQNSNPTISFSAQHSGTITPSIKMEATDNLQIKEKRYQTSERERAVIQRKEGQSSVHQPDTQSPTNRNQSQHILQVMSHRLSKDQLIAQTSSKAHQLMEDYQIKASHQSSTSRPRSNLNQGNAVPASQVLQSQKSQTNLNNDFQNPNEVQSQNSNFQMIRKSSGASLMNQCTKIDLSSSNNFLQQMYSLKYQDNQGRRESHAQLKQNLDQPANQINQQQLLISELRQMQLSQEKNLNSCSNYSEMNIKKQREEQDINNQKNSGLIGQIVSSNTSAIKNTNQQQPSKAQTKQGQSSKNKIKQTQSSLIESQKVIAQQMNPSQMNHTSFFNSKRNSQQNLLNPDLIKTQFYKTSSAFGNQSQKMRSSSNPKQPKLTTATNQNQNLHQASRIQNFILQHDTNSSGQHMQNLHQAISQAPQSIFTPQTSTVSQNQKNNSTTHQLSNFKQQSSLSTHSYANKNKNNCANLKNTYQTNSPINIEPSNDVAERSDHLIQHQSIPLHSRTRSQEVISNSGNIVGSNTTRAYNNNNNQGSQNSQNSKTNNCLIPQHTAQGVVSHVSQNGMVMHANLNNQGQGSGTGNAFVSASQILAGHFNSSQPPLVRNKTDRVGSNHFSNSIKRMIDQNAIPYSSATTTTANTSKCPGSLTSAQQFISNQKQHASQQSNPNTTNNSSKQNQNLTNSPVSTHKNNINSLNVGSIIKKSNRIDSFASRVNNMANVFDSNIQHSNNNSILHHQSNIPHHYSSIPIQVEKNDQLFINIMMNNNNNNQNSSNINYHSGQNNMVNLQGFSNNNSNNNLSNYISNNTNSGNYSSNTRNNLNIKTTATQNHINSISRNNTPLKQKSIGENMISFPSQNHSQPIYAPSSSGVIPGNYSCHQPTAFYPTSSVNISQPSSNVNTARNSTSQRGITKTSSLIRFRQNQ